MHWIDKEMERLEGELERGEITHAEYIAEERYMHEELAGKAEENAQRAYDDTLGGW